MSDTPQTNTQPDDASRPLTLEERQARVAKLEAEVQALEAEVLKEENRLRRDVKLTERQAAFVREYLIDLNGLQAATRAGYSADTAGEMACYLLKLPKIRRAVDAAMAVRASRLGLSQDHVLNELHILANSDVNHYYIDDEGQVRTAEGAPEGATRAISSIKRRTTVKTDKDGNKTVHYDVELRLWDKPNPLRLVGKHMGLNFSDRVEVTGKDGAPIVAQVVRQIVDVTGDVVEGAPEVP